MALGNIDLQQTLQEFLLDLDLLVSTKFCDISSKLDKSEGWVSVLRNLADIYEK